MEDPANDHMTSNHQPIGFRGPSERQPTRPWIQNAGHEILENTDKFIQPYNVIIVQLNVWFLGFYKLFSLVI